ncbi:MAG: acyl-CoA dehydrogenase family protein [Rhodospirillales bacterium]|nr:acyl-CoA dehydrogenase family protein [Rhodospirillales bacterium]
MPLDRAMLDQFLETVTGFVDERLIPAEAEVDATDKVPDAIVDEMKALGLFGLTIPEEYGGLGLAPSEQVEVAWAITHAAPAFRSAFGTNVAIGSQGLVIDGTGEQKQKYLPGMASGEIVAAFALTEPDIGSDAGSVKTRADRDGNGYVLNGTKRYITNAPIADTFTVMARTDQKEKGSRGVSAFIVEANTPGIRLGTPENKMGQKGAHICDVIFEDCHIPGDALIGGVEGQGFKTAMKVLDRGRLHVAATCCGVADRLIRESVAFALDREQFGQPIADFQLVQAMLADSQTEHDVAWALVRDTARRFEAGEPITRLGAEAKYYASEMVGRVADRAVQIHGGAGYINDYPAARLYRDVRIYRLYEGTSQIQQLVIARDMLKEARAQR